MNELSSLLKCVCFYEPHEEYLCVIQDNQMGLGGRRVVIISMASIIENKRMDYEILILAINIFDRFLSKIKVENLIRDVKVIGVGCIVLADNVRSSLKIDSSELIEEELFTIECLESWVNIIKTSLNDDIYSIIASDIATAILKSEVFEDTSDIEKFSILKEFKLLYCVIISHYKYLSICTREVTYVILKKICVDDGDPDLDYLIVDTFLSLELKLLGCKTPNLYKDIIETIELETLFPHPLFRF